MSTPTLVKALLAGLASVTFVCFSTPAFAQHGGGHAGGGGGGFHGGGGGSAGGGSHGGGYSGGGYHGGSYGGGYHGGSGGGGYHAGAGSYGGRGSYGGMRGGASSMRGSYHPWASEGHSVRDSSPGWHSFERSPNGGAMSARSGAAGTGRTGTETGASHNPSASHVAMADGQWHGFGAGHPGSTLASNRAGAIGIHNQAWLGTGWRGGFRGGFGYPAFGCWGCGWGWGGWGLGFGWGWGWGWWNPFWAWSPYWWYTPTPWLDGYYTAPSYIDPYSD